MFFCQRQQNNPSDSKSKFTVPQQVPPFRIVFNLKHPTLFTLSTLHNPSQPLFLALFFSHAQYLSIHLVYISACVCVLFLWAYCTDERMMMVVVGTGSFRLAGDFFLSTASTPTVEGAAATGKGDCYLTVCFSSL